jgi:hypothetical protein
MTVKLISHVILQQQDHTTMAWHEMVSGHCTPHSNPSSDKKSTEQPSERDIRTLTILIILVEIDKSGCGTTIN